MKKLHFEIEKEGMAYHTWCPELPGCHTHGKTIQEAMTNLKDAINLYLETILEEQIALKSLKLKREVA